MTSKHIDLTALRLITESDEEMERELFADFISGSDENIAKMSRHCIDGGDLDWCEQAHALKGASSSLGAAKLAELCALAQGMQIATQSDRAGLLDEIKAEYKAVKQYLEKIW